MSGETLSGILWGPIKRRRDELAASTVFQEWVGAADAEEALEYIFIFEVDDEPNAGRYAVIMPGGGLGLNRTATGTGMAAFNRNHASRIGLVETVAWEATAAEDFITDVSSILLDLLGLAATTIWETLQELPETEERGFRWQHQDGRKGYQKYFEITEIGG